MSRRKRSYWLLPGAVILYGGGLFLLLSGWLFPALLLMAVATGMGCIALSQRRTSQPEKRLPHVKAQRKKWFDH